MTIEFSCDNCGKALSTTDDKAGRKAKCPGCGEAVLVPDAPTEDDYGLDDVAASTATRTCPMCGAENPVRAKVCEACGEPLKRDSRERGEPQIVSLDDVLSSAWGRYKECLGLAVGGNLIAGIVMLLGGVPLLGIAIAVAVIVDQQQAEPPMGLVLSFFPALFLAFAVALFILPGYYRFYIGLARGDATGLGELFSGGRYMLRYFLWSLVYGIAVLVGSAFLIVPGIAVVIWFWPYAYVICDENPSLAECIPRTFALSRLNWVTSLALFAVWLIVTFFLAILGIIPCVGAILLVANLFIVPYWQILFATAYVKMSGQAALH
jgi:DNA-directed RNA polymerase subunit RPC12/RpoP/ribosomal protein L40E